MGTKRWEARRKGSRVWPQKSYVVCLTAQKTLPLLLSAFSFRQRAGVLHYPSLFCKTLSVIMHLPRAKRREGGLCGLSPLCSLFLSSSPSQVQPDVDSMASLSLQDTKDNLVIFWGLLCILKPQSPQTLFGHTSLSGARLILTVGLYGHTSFHRTGKRHMCSFCNSSIWA